MGNLYLSSNMAWEIRKIFPCPRLPKAQISWSLYGHNWGLPTSRHAHMMNNDVCVCPEIAWIPQIGSLSLNGKNVVLKF